VTIAACYLSPEGVVLGADSTTTYGTPAAPHYYNNSQKLFEVGEDSTLGIVTWGLGGLQTTSHRAQVAVLSDTIVQQRPATVQAVADLWIDQFWTAYNDPNNGIAPFLAQCKALSTKAPYDATTPAGPTIRTQDEEQQFNSLRINLVAGFCIAGHVLPSRVPDAFEIVFDPLGPKPSASAKAVGYWFWGAPNMIQRLIYGVDDNLKASIMTSGKWTCQRRREYASAAGVKMHHGRM
jgi:hypothetical protein